MDRDPGSPLERSRELSGPLGEPVTDCAGFLSYRQCHGPVGLMTPLAHTDVSASFPSEPLRQYSRLAFFARCYPDVN
jgi:hypothetical protein